MLAFIISFKYYSAILDSTFLPTIPRPRPKASSSSTLVVDTGVVV